jgi:galactokinase
MHTFGTTKMAHDFPADDPNLFKAIDAFRTHFGSDPEVAAFAPGRVNLIGEHTDYNDGFVLPFALPFRTIVVASKIDDTCGYSSIDSNVLSCTIDSAAAPVSFNVGPGLTKGQPAWANYVKGTVFQYLKDLPFNFAFNAVIVSNVPLGRYDR